MTKELEALEDIAIYNCNGVLQISDTEEYEIIKKALQRLEAIDNSKPSEALECLEEIIHEFYEPHYELSGEYSYKNELLRRCENEVNTIKQYLLKAQEQEKVLKIIFEKYVDLNLLDCDDEVGQYNRHFGKSRQLTEEEFNIIKETLE